MDGAGYVPYLIGGDTGPQGLGGALQGELEATLRAGLEDFPTRQGGKALWPQVDAGQG